MKINGIDGLLESSREVKVVPAGYDNSKMGREDFLKVLLADIQWQDPLEAKDISEFINNTVKLRELEVLNSFENSVSGLKSVFDSYALFFSSSFIGKKVIFEGNSTYVENGKGKFSFSLEGSAKEVVVTVIDSEGNVVERKVFSNLSPGEYPVEIENPDLGTGYVTVQVSAVSPDGKNVDVSVKGIALVDRIEKDADGTVYAVAGGERIPIDKIVGIGG